MPRPLVAAAVATSAAGVAVLLASPLRSISPTLIGKSLVPSIGETALGSQPGCGLARFQMLSIAFHTDEAPVIGSLTRWTCSRSGQAMALTLALIQPAFGGSWNSRCAQRQVARPVAWRSDASRASIACGCIGP